MKLPKPLGFNLKCLPNKQWLLDIIKTLDPDHSIFRLPDKNQITKILSSEELRYNILTQYHFILYKNHIFNMNFYNLACLNH